ncbi:MAG: PDZ domain-containing protein [Saccharospirillaceae bacterium]|nr:PDZ domain-containing protein [Saccharospirillaceae bacterium]MCD8530344.1 PDZ domain-containing protein [Saccharospirillaceae bacterium]
MADNVAELMSWQRWTLVLGKTALTVLLSWQLAHLTWLIVAPEPLLLKAPSQARGEPQGGALAGTGQYHLFGDVAAQPVETVTKEVDAPDTRLRLQLLGVTRSTSNEASSAIIAPKGGQGEFYRIGDAVQGRTRLAGVYDDKVILDTNGKLETLKFDEESSAGISAKAVEAPRADVRASGSLRERFKQVRNPGDFMSVVTDEVASDAEGAMREMGLEAIGSGQGYRVQPGSMLTALQMQPGDIVLSVNGQALGDPQSDQQLLQQVSSEGNARIEVQRGNSRFVVNHKLN